MLRNLTLIMRHLKLPLLVLLFSATLFSCKKEKESYTTAPEATPQDVPQQNLQLIAEGDMYIYSQTIFKTNDVVGSYVFDFGDGTKDTIAGLIVRHVYTEPGTYTVTVSNGNLTTSKTITITYGTERIKQLEGWLVAYSETETQPPYTITKDPQANLKLSFDVQSDTQIELQSNGKYFPSNVMLYFSEFKNNRMVFKSGIKENEFTLNISYKYDKDKNILNADCNFYNIRRTANTIYDVTGMATLDLNKL